MATASAAGAAPAAADSVVILDYEELTSATTSDALRAKIERAYGYDGLGILAVRGVPDFVALRGACLPYAYRFGNLPHSVKARYVHKESSYSFGWSHGKEKLEGRPDTAKGSYYFNPLHDRPETDEAVIAAHTAFAHPNIWPTDEDCAGMREACMACGTLIVNVGRQLARHCDAYVRSVDASYGEHGLERIVSVARFPKARLLYYFAVDAPDASPVASPIAPAAPGLGGAGATAGAGGAAAEEKKEDGAAAAGARAAKSAAAEEDVSSWCGWHNDHGSLTGLTPAVFFDAEGKQVACPDPAAGLYIRTRHGKTVKVSVPSDAIAYQIGETAQVHTGGILQATPHCVRAAAAAGISRGTLAVFMEPEWDERMAAPAGADSDRILRGARGELLPRGVPSLVDRWDVSGTRDFGGFTTKTLSMYY